MSRPADSFYRIFDLRRRYTDMDVVDVALHRVLRQVQRAITSVQAGQPVAFPDYLFGASDGFQDVTFELQVAMDKVGENGGGELFLPKGTYTISDALVYNHDNLVVFGEGTGTNIVQSAAGTSHFTADTLERIGLRDVQLTNTGGGVNVNVDWTDCEESFIERVFFLDAFSCIRLNSCDGVHVTNCSDSNTGSVCFSLTDAGVGSTDDIVCESNNFESNTPGLTYITTITGGISPRNIRIEGNRPLPVPSHVVPASNLITRDILFGAPDRTIAVTGANAVDDIEVTFPNDWRIFTVTAATPVFNNNAPGNLRLSAATFTGDAAAGTDTLMLVCDGTNWLEVSRSIN